MNNSVSYKCPSCDGTLSYNEKTKHLVCDYCDRNCDDLKIDIKGNFTNNQVFSGYDCPSCGARMLADEKTITAKCIFCDSDVITRDRIEDYKTPDYILPFVYDKQRAISEFKQFCSYAYMSDKGMLSDEVIDGMQSVYVPAWLYSSQDTELYMLVEGVKRAIVTNEKTENSPNDEMYIIEMSGVVSFKDIPVNANSSIDYKYIESIEPFDYTQQVPFDPKYILGHFADRNDMRKDEAHKRAIHRMVHTSKKLFTDVVNGSYSTKRALDESIMHDFNPENAKSVLIPVWFLYTSFEGEYYYYTINGQTGKVAGILPASKPKVWFWRSFIFIFAMAFAAFFGYLYANALGVIIATIVVGCYIIKNGGLVGKKVNLVGEKLKADEYIIPNTFKMTRQAAKYIGKRKQVDAQKIKNRIV